MLFIDDTCTDPYHNLAEEEYLLKNFTEPVFRLWRNSDAIIVGRYQNTLAEIDYGYVKKNGIKVVRRMTGGGAVFHDLGNLNFTFIQQRKPEEDTAEMFRRFTAPILKALNSIGVKAYLEGRNDLLIDGKKFSGNSVCIWKDRILQHGTLLFDTSISNLSAALRSRPEKFVGKAVQSNRSRVTNIREHLSEPHDIEWFKCFLGDYVSQLYESGDRFVRYNFTEAQNEEIDALKRTKYGTDEWNFGHSPKFSRKSIRKFSGGILEFYFTVDKGVIKDLQVKGDYFFTRPTEEFEERFANVVFTKEAVAAGLSRLRTEDYFTGITKDDLLYMFFGQDL